MKNFHLENSDQLMKHARELVPLIKRKVKEIGADATIRYLQDYASALHTRPEALANLTCTKGCSMCCHDIILMAPSEAQMIKNAVKHYKIKPNKKRSKLMNTKKASDLKWAEKLCPYLGDDNLCKIYEFRPLACRTHNNIGPLSDCDKSEGKKSHQQQYILDAEAIFMALCLTSKIDAAEDLIPLHKIF